ncbi:MAG: nucleotidyltransferase domain-containing protein [bacterium]|nr:nucleotidyltransferase domain-containing protein [bacterium]
MLDGRIQKLLAEVKSGLERLYGDRLRGLFLFGSHARGEAEAGSDLDVLIILDEVEHYYGELERTGELTASLSLRYDLTVSRVFMSEADWRRGDGPFLQNVREDAIAA